MKYLTIFLTLFGVSCQGTPVATPPVSTPVVTVKAAKSAAPVTMSKFSYSPFVVTASGNDFEFHEITFKDVGIKAADADKELIYETIAESLANDLSDDYQAAVSFDETQMQVEEHRHCGDHHLYVDMWQHDKGWGYSLWSGCGDDDNFAVNEIDVAPSADVTDTIQPLTAHIVKTLDAAHARKCFTKTC